MPRQTETALYVTDRPGEVAKRVEIMARGAYISQIRYSDKGFMHEVYVDNGELIFQEEWELDEM